MSEAPDPLEAELSSLRPHELSPGLRRRIAEGLADAPPATGGGRRWGWWLALAGGFAAACVAVVLYRWGSGRHVKPDPIVWPQPAPLVAIEDSEPTLLTYQRALARSPEELDALLDKQAVAAPEAIPELGRIGAFTRSDAALHALLGED